MAVSRITLFAFAVLAIISTFVAKLQNIVRVDSGSVTQDVNGRFSEGDNLFPDDRYRHVMWFVQISDLHLSIFHDFERAEDLKTFCIDTVPTIKPSVVLATGDLVDAKMPDHLGSRQYVEEWQIYQQVLYETGVTQHTTWLDIRGNHDNFNVLSVDAEDNLYRNYSVQGSKHRKSYSYHLQKDSEKYTFIGIDACMEPGPKRPFNFLGVLKSDEYNLLQTYLNESQDDNMTIWFGHYPTSTIVSPHPGVRELMRFSGPYLCGHLHTLGGMVPAMYTLQSTGSLELELADWKENRKFRLAAVDYGMFTFVDHYVGQWPAILVTNPKDARFTMPVIEPLYRVESSTHIRVLLFSPYPIVEAKFMIDSSPWYNLTHVDGPLFVAPWKPYLFSEGLHKMNVFASDEKGNGKLSSHEFSLDGSRPIFPLGARFALMGHISLGQIIFAILLIVTVLPLCILRIIYTQKKGQSIIKKSEYNCCRRLIFKLFLLSSTDSVFWPLILGALYSAVGPWFIGYIIDEHIGVVFVWGIIISHHFLPGGLTYFVGVIYLSTFYLPLIFCLSHLLYQHSRSVMEGARAQTCGILSYLCRHFVMLVFVAWEMLCSVVYLFSYGTLSFLLGFTHSWSVVLALVLWRTVATLPEAKIIRLGIWQRRQTAGTPLLPGSNVERQMSEHVHEGINPS